MVFFLLVLRVLVRADERFHHVPNLDVAIASGTHGILEVAAEGAGSRPRVRRAVGDTSSLLAGWVAVCFAPRKSPAVDAGGQRSHLLSVADC